jgi:hypothetical protein
MGRSQENNSSAIRDEELLNVLVQLHYHLAFISPYDALAREAWFDGAQSLLDLADGPTQQVEWLLSLARAYQQHLGQGLPLCMIAATLLGRRDHATAS